jgi:hypothetical protein
VVLLRSALKLCPNQKVQYETNVTTDATRLSCVDQTGNGCVKNQSYLGHKVRIFEASVESCVACRMAHGVYCVIIYYHSLSHLFNSTYSIFAVFHPGATKEGKHVAWRVLCNTISYIITPSHIFNSTYSAFAVFHPGATKEGKYGTNLCPCKER